MIANRARITSLPALAAGLFAASVPLRAVAQDASPHAHGATNPFADLGLPEIELEFTTENFTGMPETLEAGRYLVTVHGEPTEEEWALGPMFVQLPEGITLEDVLAIDPSTLEGPPEWFYSSVVAGGPAVMAGGATTAYGVIDLPPGDWFAAGSSLSQPPVVFAVTGEMPANLPEPEAHVTLTIGEMVIEITDGAFAMGDNVVKVENVGAQPHVVELAKVPDGTTGENIEATIATWMGGTPEAEPLAEEDFGFFAASGDQSSGTVQWVVVSIAEPGTHAAICWIPDLETGMPHAMMGMHAVFEIDE